jgi:hypothetical protein
MNTWRARLFVGLLLWAVTQCHAWVNAPLPNTRFWALIFFGSAATLEALICLFIPQKLDGQLCDHMLLLGSVCIVVDALGFYAYMTKTPSIYYNTVMGAISYVQYLRLLFVDSDHALSVWNNLVRRAASIGTKLNYQKALK